MSYPSYLSYMAREFSGVSNTTFRIPPRASGTLQARGQMSFCLPTNCLVSAKDIRLVFSASAKLAANNQANTGARLPKASALIERIEVTAGGISIDAGVHNQNALQQALDNMKVRELDPVDSHSKIYRNVSGVNLKQFGGADGATGNTVAETYNNDASDATQFSVSLGNFFETVSPNMLDLSLLPEIVVTVHLAGNSVITSGTNATPTGFVDIPAAGTANVHQSQFEVKNYSLLVPCYSIDDGMYQKVIAARMNEAGYLTCTFTGYEAFSDTFTGVTRAATAASSLDKIIAVFRGGDHANVKGAVRIKGTSTRALSEPAADSAAALTTARTLDQNTAGVLTQADCLGGEEYLPYPMNFQAPMAAFETAVGNADPAEPELQFSINSVAYPQFNPKLSQWYVMTKDAFEVSSTQSKSYQEWLQNRCVLAVRLNLPGSTLLRAKSGLDTRGSNSSVLLSAVNQQGNMADDRNVLLYLQSTRELRLGQGKTLQVIL